ncbi:MAG: hypothetical protein ACREJN_07415 [Nitrospiraceae bacterium]
MKSIPKRAGVLSYVFLLCLGLSTTAQAQDMKGCQSEGNGGKADGKDMTLPKGVHFIRGNVVRVGYRIFIEQTDGTEVILHTDNTTQMMKQFNEGDRIMAKVNNQNHALAISPMY